MLKSYIEYNLHSNMVRLKEWFMLYLPSYIQYLHSNMVRLKVAGHAWNSKVIIKDLHSNMVRLKVLSKDNSRDLLIVFTFQYGKIKSIAHFSFGRSLSIFTFQYGKIKSKKATVDAMFSATFTFQYGKIKSWYRNRCYGSICYLHSNMVRLKAWSWCKRCVEC